MSVDGWKTVLVLGGIRSGKSQFAESLLADTATVRYVATAAPAPDDDHEWAARITRHRDRRPAHWSTDEAGSDPETLTALIAQAKPDETLLVDDLGNWVAARLAGPNGGDEEIDPGTGAAGNRLDGGLDALVAAIRQCPARLVLVSPEVGLSLVPTTPLGRAFADAVGEANQAVAAVSDAVVLVIAGQTTWLKPSAPEVLAVAATERTHPVDQAPEAERPRVTPAVVPPSRVDVPARDAARVTTTARMTTTTSVPDATIQIGPDMDLPMPDEQAAVEAELLLGALDVSGAGLGELQRVVTFAAGTQSRSRPRSWRSPSLLLLHGDHVGAASAGAPVDESARRAEQARAGRGPFGVLAARVDAELRVIDAPEAQPMEAGPVLTAQAVEQALAYGWQIASEAIQDGADLLIIGACGAGTETAATAVLAATAGAEPATVLPRVVVPGPRAVVPGPAAQAGPADPTPYGESPGAQHDGQGKRLDDNAWMLRCAAVRDALHRTRRATRSAHDVLIELAGGDIAIATGILLGAAAARTPVLLDGPVGVAAALISRDLAGQARHWCLLPDHGGSPLLRQAADVLGLSPFTDLRLGLGEGANALVALPVLRAALELAGE